jgi:hypothetical protein
MPDKKPAAEEEIPEPEKSRRFMANPMQWPGLALPVKNKQRRGPGNFPEMGVMLSERPTVYLVDLFELSKYNGKKVEDIPHKDYDDLQGVVDDGWVVD